MARQSRTKGIIISYCVTAFRAFSQFFLTSVYLKRLGFENYGFYQYVYSIASYAIILDFGISAVVNKFTIEFREKKDDKGVQNALFLCLMMTLCAVVVIALVGLVIVGFASHIFGELSNEKLVLARRLLVIIILYIVTLIFQHYFEGILLSNEHYVTLRSISLFQIIAKFGIVLLLLYSDWGSISIAISDLTAALICLFISVTYAFVVLHTKIKFYYFDRIMLKAASKLAGSLALQSVILYLNSSIDKYLLGRLLSNVAVTVYTVAMNFSSFFDEIPSVIQRMYLPQAVKLVANGADGEKLTDFVIKPGRFQFVLCGGMLGGFILYGKDLITLWAGKDAILAWWIALLLMSASILPLIQNVCLAILTAKNKRMFRSYVLAGIAFLNFFLTVFLVKRFGLLGAPIGTFVSLILGNNLAMNWYYKNKIGLNISRLFKSILKGILPCIIITTLLSSILLLPKIQLTWAWFLLKCLIFMLIYSIFLWSIGFNSDEKNLIRKRVPFLK